MVSLTKLLFQDQENWPEEVLSKSLEETCLERGYQEKCLLILAHALESYEDSISEGRTKAKCYSSNLISRYQLMVSSLFLTTLPWSFPGKDSSIDNICVEIILFAYIIWIFLHVPCCLFLHDSFMWELFLHFNILLSFLTQ